MLFSVDKIRRLLPASVPQKKQARHRKSGALLVGGDEEDQNSEGRLCRPSIILPAAK